MTFDEKLNKAYESFNGYESNLINILIDMLEEKDLDEFSEWLDNEPISDDINYKYYNKAFEKIYGHPAFDENGNCYK